MKVPPTSVSRVLEQYQKSGKLDATTKPLDEKTAGMVRDLAVLDFSLTRAADGGPEDLDGKRDQKVNLSEPEAGNVSTSYEGDERGFKMSSQSDNGQGGGAVQLITSNPKTLTMLNVDWQEGGKATATAYEINEEDLGASRAYQMSWQLVE